MKVWGITGWKNSGKTTLTERLVTEFTRRGLTVSTLKHSHHAFDVDHPGTDSARHRAAGASEVLIGSSKRWALMHELEGEDEPSLDDHLARLTPVDLVLVEGYKSTPIPKIEVVGPNPSENAPVAVKFEGVRAFACDGDVPLEGLPVFGRDDIAAIADFIWESLS